MSHRILSLAELRKLVSKMPFNTLVGLQIHKGHKDGVTLRLPVEKKLHNVAGTLHGGAMATLADAAAGMATFRHYGGRPITTVEMKISYFRPVNEGLVYARAKLMRTGATLSVGQVELRDSRKNLLAVAIVTYLLLDARGKEAAPSGSAKAT